MTVKAVYPNGILPWSNRVDKVNTVFAADPNTLASELVAVQSTLGVNPHIETAPPDGGSRIVYNNVAARIHDVQMGNQTIVCSLYNNGFTVKNDGGNAGPGQMNPYAIIFDPQKHFNGTDITTKEPGWYLVTAHQRFSWAGNGWHGMQLLISGNVVDDAHWSWDFPENSNGDWRQQPKILSISWQGVIHKGHRISVISRNASNISNVGVKAAYLKMSWIRSVPATVQG